MNTQPQAGFTFEEVFQASWGMTKKHWREYLLLVGGAILVYIVIAIVLGVLAKNMIFEQIISIALGVYLALFMAKGALTIARGQKLDLYATARMDWKVFLNAVAASLLFYVVVMIGFVLVIIPGIIAALTFGYYIYSIADKQTGVMESLEDSLRLTKGHRWTIFAFELALGLLAVAAVCLPALVIYFVAAGSNLDSGVVPLMLLGIIFALEIIAAVIVLGVMGVSGQAYMYLKMRAETPLLSK